MPPSPSLSSTVYSPNTRPPACPSDSTDAWYGVRRCCLTSSAATIAPSGASRFTWSVARSAGESSRLLESASKNCLGVTAMVDLYRSVGDGVQDNPPPARMQAASRNSREHGFRPSVRYDGAYRVPRLRSTMRTRLSPSARILTVADLVRHLGDIPLERIRMKP